MTKNGVLRTPKKVKKNRTFFPSRKRLRLREAQAPSLARSASAFVDPQKLYIIPQDIF